MAINFENLPDDLKKKIQQFSQMQQNLEYIINQRIQMETRLRETELAVEELEKTEPNEVIYKSIGGIMVKSDRDKLLAEKKSQKTSLDMRIKTLKQKEERARGQIETTSKAIQADLQNQ
ncbi:MAG: Prefoldin subunit beta [Promethearchaeota archaeon]|nr:MAG: Prefoldin subunit beta [Candidatus Lokiarchaeota archaeon]